MSATLVTHVPDEAEVREIARQVQARHLYLIQPTQGGAAVLAPFPVDGYRTLMRPESKRISQALGVAA